MKNTLLLMLALIFVTKINAQRKISFSALDGVTITADAYIIDDKKPMILLFHQAGYSRGEYKDIAPELNKLGYNCIAIDQRSGNAVNGVVNETAQSALSKNLDVTYLEAEKDMIAAIKYISFMYRPSKFFLWGSSYSASLALKLGTLDARVNGIIAFSPGEYFNGGLDVKESIKKLYKPTFVTSTKTEAPDVANMVKGLELVHQFIPKAEGIHGSSALWTSTPNHDEYWTALKSFLEWAITWKP